MAFGDCVRLGLIGAGRLGHMHAENCVRRIDLCKLIAVADINPAAAESCASRFGIKKAIFEPQRLMEDPEIDAVLICTTNDVHAELVRQAAEVGKHVFCEEPIALSLPVFEETMATVEASRIVFQSGFARRFDSYVADIRERFREGQVGHARLLRLVSRDPGPPSMGYLRASGGILLDVSLHDLDAASYILGEQIVTLNATPGQVFDPQIAQIGDLDAIVLVAQCESGGLTIIDNTRRSVYGFDRRAELLGTKGLLSSGEGMGAELAALADGQGVHRPMPLQAFIERQMGALRREVRAFVDTIRSHGEAEVGAEASRRALRGALAAQRSLALRRPVDVDEVDAPLDDQEFSS